MPRLRTCKRCGNKFEKENTEIYKNKTYCIPCAKVMKETEEERKRSDPYCKLIDYVMRFFDNGKIPQLIFRQIQKFYKESNYTYVGIAYTLWYAASQKNKRPSEKYGIYYVKDFYDEASEYFANLIEKTKESEEQLIEKKVDLNEVNKVSRLEKRNDKKLLLDIDEIMDEDVKQ